MRPTLTSTIFAAASLIVTIGTVAFSLPAGAALLESPQIAVSFDKVSATTETGRLQLDQRIHRAARSVCATTGGDPIATMRCISDAQGRARAEVDARLSSPAVQLASR